MNRYESSPPGTTDTIGNFPQYLIVDGEIPRRPIYWPA